MRQITIIAFLLLLLSACGGNKQQQSSMPKETAEEFTEVNELLMQLNELLDDPTAFPERKDWVMLKNWSDSLNFDYDPTNMDSVSLVQCKQLKRRLSLTQARIDSFLLAQQQTQVLMINHLDQQLIDNNACLPVYVERGDRLMYHILTERPVTVKLYNADSHQLLKTYTNKREVLDSIDIKYKGVYLIDIDTKDRQYVDARIVYRPGSIDRMLGKQYKVDTEEIEAQKGEFLAYTKPGIQMHNLFEEPRKFTLRSQLKAAFSSVTNSDRAIVAVQVPKGATDILYSLRIDTNEKPASSDGEFYDNMELSYRRIKVLGLPVYESHRGAGIISTLLGENVPPRKEDAYINMYVFYNAAQAKKFQDGANPANLAYSIDYSTMGTQSCNGRIPSKGNRTVYLGFQNERVRYTNYIWLEAISAVPKSEYYKPEFVRKEIP